MDSQQLHDYFDRVWLVNLDRRPDRLADCTTRFAPPAWPFKTPERFRAIDGKIVPSPSHWRAGSGAWGVFRSHCSLIERCLNEQVPRILILEDDAVLDTGFAENVKTFLENVPPAWHLLYLGGQCNHYNIQQHPHRVVNQHVVVPWSVNRLQAFALSLAGMEIVYRHLTSNDWQPKHHIDHHLERLERVGGIVFYAPTTWLIGQGEGLSDICNRDLPVRFFDWRTKPPKPAVVRKPPPATRPRVAPRPMAKTLPTVLAAVGPYRGGTSCVAGAVHQLGVSMGNGFFTGGQHASPKGCFEAKRLFDICMACYPEPRFLEGKPYRRRVAMLRGWLEGRAGHGAVIGAKHPKLCLMVPEITEAWPGCKLVVVHRPIDESVQSLDTLKWWSKTQRPEDLIRRLVDTRDKDIAKVPTERVLHVAYADVLADPRGQLERIAAFAGVTPTPEQYKTACLHVDPTLKHYDARTTA